MPEEVRRALREEYYAAVAQASMQGRQLEKVLGALDQAGVAVALLKGAAVARSVYPDPALRGMGDLDLWVRRHDLDRARDALGRLGYWPHSKPERPLALQDAYLGETALGTEEPGASVVELHWTVFAGEWLRRTAAIDEKAVWERSIPVDGLAASQMAPEDTILHTCLHLAINHQMAGLGLRPLLDLALVRDKQFVDWNAVVQRARAWRVTVATWLVLNLLATLFGDELDQLPLAALCPCSLRQWLLRPFLGGESPLERRNLAAGLTKFAFLLLLVDRFADALRLLGRAFFPEREWLVLRYGLEDAPNWQVWRQRLWHPIRVLARSEV